MRISFFGGPGSGKSTTSARIFAELKDRQASVELVSEYVKAWAYQNRVPNGFDQVYLFAKQQQYEYRMLSNGVKNIITDSPAFLSVYYANKYMSQSLGLAIRELCRLYDNECPVYNIFLERKDKPYDPKGRFQTQEQAAQMDGEIWEELIRSYPTDKCIKIPYQNRDEILQTVLNVYDK